MRVVLVTGLLLSAVLAQDEADTSPRRAYAGAPPKGVLVSDAGTVKWEALLGDPLLKQGRYLSELAFAPDGTWLAAADWAGQIKLWDKKTGRLIRVIAAHGGIVRALAISGDGKWIAAAGRDGFRVWEAAAGKLVVDRKVPSVRALDFRAKTSQLLYTEAAVVRVWDMRKRAVTQTLSVGADVERARFSPDGARVVTVSRNTTIRVWDMETGRTTRTFKAPRDVTGIAVTPDNKRLVAMAMTKYLVWNLGTGKLERSAEGPRVMGSTVAISPDGTRAASGGLDNEIVVIRIRDGQLLWRSKGHKGSVNDICYSPYGTMIATGSMDGTVRLWEAETGKPLRPPAGHINDVCGIAFHPEGKRMVTASGDGSLCIWDTDKLRMLHHVPASKFPLRAVAALPPGFLVVGHDWVPAMWGLDGKKLRAFHGEFAGGVYAVAVDPAGKWFITGHQRALLRKWGVKTGGALAEIVTHRSGVQSLAVARDGSWIVSGDFKGKVFLHDTSLRSARELKGHTKKVGGIALHPTAALIATASDDGTVRVWNAVTGHCVHELDHRGGVTAVAFSEDGRWIYGARWDGPLMVWSTKPFGYVDCIQVDGGPVSVVARRGRIWVGCGNGTVCVYQHTPK